MEPGSLLVVILGLVALWVALIAVLWAFRPRDVRLRDLAGVVPDLLRLIRDLIGDSSVPARVRLALVGLLAWLISPIDLVPDFIPVLGPIDDLVVAILVLRYVRRRLGEDDLRGRWQGTPQSWELLAAILR